MLRTHKNIFSNLKRKANFKKEQKALKILSQCLRNLDINADINSEFKNNNGEGEISGFQVVLKGLDKATDKARIERDLYRMEYIYPYSQYQVGFMDEDNSKIATEVLSHEKILSDIKEIVSVKRQKISLLESFTTEFSKICISLKRNIFEREILKVEKLRYKRACDLIRKKCVAMLVNKYTLEKLKDAEYFIKINIQNRQKMPPLMRIGVLIIFIAFALLLWNWTTLNILDKTIISIAGFTISGRIKDEIVKSFEDLIMASTHAEENRLGLIQEAIRKKQDEI